MWSNFYASGGWGMHPVSVFGFLLLAASALYALRPGERFARLLLPLGIVTFSAGLLGTTVGMCNSFHYIPQVPHVEQVQILALGCEESLHNLVLALILIVLAGLMASVGLLRRSAGAAAA